MRSGQQSSGKSRDRRERTGKSIQGGIEGFPLVELPIELGENGTEASKYQPLITSKAAQFADEFLQKSHYVEFWGRIYPSDNFHYLNDRFQQIL
jgi:hypothetical protein